MRASRRGVSSLEGRDIIQRSIHITQAFASGNIKDKDPPRGTLEMHDCLAEHRRHVGSPQWSTRNIDLLSGAKVMRELSGGETIMPE